jgi:subtilisin family serine protease
MPTQRLCVYLLIVCCSALPGGCGGPEILPAETTAPQTNTTPDQLVVNVVPGADEDAVADLYEDVGGTVEDRLTDLQTDLLNVDPENRDDAAETLSESDLIAGVSGNGILQIAPPANDELFASQWHLTAARVTEAWPTTAGSPGIIVAVLDTGVDTDHPDLADALLPGGDTTATEAGWEDRHGHGTSVAGVIAAATNNAQGVASVAPGVKLLPIRVADAAGVATEWSIATGIALAVSEGAQVINISFAPESTEVGSLIMQQAERARIEGALVIFAAGNTGQQVDRAATDAALFVSATSEGDAWANFSTYGSFVDVAAPGVSIQTTQMGGSYGASSGTSLSTPIVSGVAALVWSLNPQFRPTTVRGVLLSTARDLGAAGDDIYYGAGLIDAKAAVSLAQSLEVQADTQPPTLAIAVPVEGAVVSAPTTVIIDVADDSDVADVVLTVDGQPLATDTVAPYMFLVNPARHASGKRILAATATDVFGNAATDAVSVTFASGTDKTPPTVSIASPANKSSVQGVITVIADASDNAALRQAVFSIDGQQVQTSSLSGMHATAAYNWNTADSTWSAGLHTVRVEVSDTAGLKAAAEIQVDVDK